MAASIGALAKSRQRLWTDCQLRPAISAAPNEVIPAGDNRVLALGTYRGHGSAGELAAPFAQLWTLKDGRITKFVQYVDSHLFRQALGA